MQRRRFNVDVAKAGRLAARATIRQCRLHMADGPNAPLGQLFEALPLPRGRAYLSLTFGGLALLFLGGVLSYASGSPDLHGGTGSYWTAFFSFHALAFGGAALLGAFPRLARGAVKLAWLAVLVAAWGVAFALWGGHHTSADGGTGPLWTLARWYLPALLPIGCGLGWSQLEDVLDREGEARQDG